MLFLCVVMTLFPTFIYFAPKICFVQSIVLLLAIGLTFFGHHHVHNGPSGSNDVA